MRKATMMAAVGAVGIGAALAFALPAGAAVTTASPPIATVQLGSTARLDANGAVVFASAKITCRAGTSAWLNVQVTEAVGNDIASGSTGINIDACTGKPTSIQAAVTPSQHPFRKGVAFAQASLQACDGSGCKTVVDQKVIQIVTK